MLYETIAPYHAAYQWNQQTRIATADRSQIDHQPLRIGRVRALEHPSYERVNWLSTFSAHLSKPDVDRAVRGIY